MSNREIRTKLTKITYHADGTVEVIPMVAQISVAQRFMGRGVHQTLDYSTDPLAYIEYVAV